MAIFKLGEILEFAIEREKESFLLYDNLGKQIRNDEVKNLLFFLRDQEKEHERFYAELLSNLQLKDESVLKKEDEDYYAYVRQMIDSSRTKEKSIIHFQLKYDEDFTHAKLKEVLDHAILREKDAVLFYVGLKPFVKTDFYKNIDIIIQEESQHIVKINRIKHILSIH